MDNKKSRMKLHMSLFAGAGAVLAVPMVVGAQQLVGTLQLVNTIINLFVPILLSVAIVMFFWGLISYILKLGDEDGRSKAINLMIWGVVAIFVMVSIWGIVRLLQGTFQVGDQTPLVPPPIQINS